MKKGRSHHMRKSIPEIAGKVAAPGGSATKARSLTEFSAPLEAITAESPNLVPGHKKIEDDNDSSWLLRYLFIGPQGGDTPLRIGIFSGIHGDKTAGAYSIVRFIRLLESHPELARGYALSLYPICNPTGFEDNTRHSRRGKDLNREFWNHSVQPEVLLLQQELSLHAFDGIISIHTDNTNEGFYGFVRGADLSLTLIEPALAAAEQFLPRDRRSKIDGLDAEQGILRDSRTGTLRAPPKVRQRPFEITLEGPAAAPVFLTECAFVAALQTILVEYRAFIAYARNL
jgi:protein MpaA